MYFRGININRTARALIGATQEREQQAKLEIEKRAASQDKLCATPATAECINGPHDDGETHNLNKEAHNFDEKNNDNLNARRLINYAAFNGPVCLLCPGNNYPSANVRCSGQATQQEDFLLPQGKCTFREYFTSQHILHSRVPFTVYIYLSLLATAIVNHRVL